MRIASLALTMLGASCLGACSFLPPSQQQEFAVSGAPAVQTGAVFRNADANLNDVLARQVCADGYEKLGEQSLPVDTGTLTLWRVRCAPRVETWYLPG